MWNIYDAIISSVNMERDTDCFVAILSRLSGALRAYTARRTNQSSRLYNVS
jgi:hypothetical protein